MQIISMRIIESIIAATVFVALCNPAAASAEAGLGYGEILKISKLRGAPSAAIVGEKAVKVRLSYNLAQALRAADEYFIVGKRALQAQGHTYFFLMTQSASKTKQGGGFCGAGTEDSISLLELDPKTNGLSLKDSKLLQSCIESISLSDDTGRSLRNRLEGLDDLGNLTFDWLDNQRYGSGSRTVHVKNGKLCFGERPNQEPR